jgi:hypothetical protein
MKSYCWNFLLSAGFYPEQEEIIKGFNNVLLVSFVMPIFED